MSNYNILLASDSNYMRYCFVTCQSVIDAINNAPQSKTNETKDRIIFTILVDESVDQLDLHKKCDSFISRNNAIVDISFDIKAADKDQLRNAPPLNGSLVAYFRIFIDQLFDDDVHICLYLDCDIIVRKDVRTLFNETNLEGFVLASVPDFCAEEDSQPNGTIRVPKRNANVANLEIPLSNYFNSGVMLINLQEYRRNNISKKCLALLDDYIPDHWDQDLFNIAVPGKLRKVLEPKWNAHLYMGLLSYNSKSSDFSLLATRNINGVRKQTVSTTMPPDVFMEQVNDPSIYHFVYMKPWDNLRFLFTNLPSTSSINLRIQEWFDTAEKVVEFSKDLSVAKYSPLYTHSYEICSLNEKINNLQLEISHQKRLRKIDRRRERNKILLIIFALFAIQLIILLALSK